MKILKSLQLLLMMAVFFINCSSSQEEQDCIKEINQDYIVGFGGKAYYYTETIEVSCDEDDQQNQPIEGEIPLLENFEYNVLKFEFNPEVGNNMSRLYFEIELRNPNNFEAKGIPLFTMRSNGNLNFETDYKASLKESCITIASNSSCILIVEIEENNSANAPNDSIELVDLKYALVRANR